MRSNAPEPNVNGSCACGNGCRTLREAVDWVFVAAAFGILFNLYDSDGIEIKAPPRTGVTYQNVVPTQPVEYPGFKPKGASAPAPTTGAKKDPAFPHLSFEGAKLRFGKALFVDARPARDYLEGHIQGAVGFDVNDFETAAPQALPRIPPTAEVLIYCSGGNCDDSVQLAKKLREMGYTNLKIYEGGYPEWKKAGMPVVTGDRP